MSKKWKIEEAGERFGKVLADSIVEGHQYIMSDQGKEVAVVVSIAEWRRLNAMKKPPKYADIKEWLLAPEARTECLTPPRQPLRHRPPPTFD